VSRTLHIQAVTNSGVAVAASSSPLGCRSSSSPSVASLLVDRFEARALLLAARSPRPSSPRHALDSVAATFVLAAVLGVGFAIAQPAEFALARGDRGVARG
jgi:hypothetical protein